MENLQKICDLVVYASIPYREQLNLNKTVKFGTEIEFERAKLDDVKMSLSTKKLLSKWLLKEDSTVKYIYNQHVFGGELISPILHDYKTCWKQLKSACHLIKRVYGLINGNSGAHIHIDSSILKDNITCVLNLVKLWTVYEHIIYRFAYGEEEYERKSLAEYAAPVSGYLYEMVRNMEEYGLIENAKDFYRYLFECSVFNSMNSGLSFLHCSGLEENEKNTIEIRCPNGTLNEIIWQNNINFFVRLFEYSASSRYDTEFINKKFKNYRFRKLEEYRNIYLIDAIELANLIFTKEEDKLYFLKQYLKINNENYQKIKQKIIEKPI